MISQKHYDKLELFNAFSDIYDEKVRLELIGVELDNLLSIDKSNPALRTSEKIEKIVSDSEKEWQLKVYELEYCEMLSLIEHTYLVRYVRDNKF